MTCEPGLQVYERFGHSALRIVDEENHEDWVFNYGSFSFDEPNFIWRFVLGKGTYYLDAAPYPIFAEYYAFTGRSITNQEINLTPEERSKLYHVLIENLQPENKKYRYNFLYDNCTTRAIEQLERAAGNVAYTLPDALKGKTFRSIIHEATANAPWTQFGIDLVLGEEVDRPLSTEHYFFSPLYAKVLYDTARRIKEDGTSEPLVVNTDTTQATPTAEMLADKPAFFLPVHAMLLLLVSISILSLFAWKRRRVLWYVDFPLLLVQGSTGCIIALLFFFSAHPAVSSNWLLLWLNPLPFVGLLLRYLPCCKSLRPIYHPLSACLLGLSLLAMPWLPQQFSPAIYLLATTLLLHSLTSAAIETKNKKRKTAKLPVGFTLLALLPGNMHATGEKELPRVVVNILVDQLRYDYMQSFLPLYGNDGFKKLLREGKIYSSAEYPMLSPDRASAAATISTGTSPCNHGIIARRYLDRTTLLPTYCIADNDYPGIGTDDHLSPSRLSVSTIGDELKLATKGAAKVYAIAPFSDAAVLTAGHAADAALWIDNRSGRWVTSTYYNTLPVCADVRNTHNAIEEQISRKPWKPLSNLVGYFNFFPSGGMSEPFEHKFKDETRFTDFKTSALVNEEVAAMTQSLIETNNIGADATTDYLAITFYAGNFRHQTDDEAPIELQDIYARLDKSIAQIISCITNKVGKEHALFVLTSTGYVDEGDDDLKQYRIPTGTFDMRRAMGLLNMYLVALYGKGQYIDAYYGRQIYFNHKCLEERQLNVVDIMRRTQEFLVQLSGVREAYSSQRLLLGAWTPGISRRRNGYNKNYSGDIMLELAPGWRCTNDNTDNVRPVRDSYLHFPIIFYGNGIQAAIDDTPVTTDRIAPTLSRAMRIRAPNGCANAPMEMDN